jgi:hypothetical protein
MVIVTINCVPNFRTPRDVCKDGNFYKNGKKYEANFNCAFAHILTSEIKNSKGEVISQGISKETADFICFRSIENIKSCDKEHTLKTGVNTW